MTYSKASKRQVSEIDQRLREAAQRHKFGVLNVLDLKSTLASKGIDLVRQCFVYDVCNPQAASTALHHDMSASVVLPCRIAVFQSDGGSVIATVRPTDLMQSTGLSGVESLAQDVEREMIAIIDEAA